MQGHEVSLAHSIPPVATADREDMFNIHPTRQTLLLLHVFVYCEFSICPLDHVVLSVRTFLWKIIVFTFNTDILCVHVLLTLTLFQKLCHTLTHPVDKETRRGGEGGSQREKEVRRRGEEASFPKGIGAKVKKKICSSTRDGKGCGNQTALRWFIHLSFIHKWQGNYL